MNDAERVWRERGLRDAALAGRAEAWRVLFDAAYEPVRVYVRWRLGGRDDEDLVQECWLIAVRKLKTFEPERGSFGSWVRGIASNVLANHLRNGRLRHTQPLTETGHQTTDDEVQRRQAEQVAITLARLSPRHEQVLRAKYLDGLSMEAIAVECGETTKAIESLLTRARQAFRELYETSEP
jgi:RNA polymerase sigma-70 factor (ECF subfamily)